MGFIPDSVIDEVLDRADIESVVSRYVQLKRTGNNLKGLCPFHAEKTPSFIVTPSRNTFKCFGCLKYGNAIRFIMEIEHMSFPEAVKYLAEAYGVEYRETGNSGDDYKKEAR